jgi:hypothetical protein
MPIPWLEAAKIAGACLVMAIVVSILPKFGGVVELITKSMGGAIVYGAALVALDFNGAKNKIGDYLRK